MGLVVSGPGENLHLRTSASVLVLLCLCVPPSVFTVFFIQICNFWSVLQDESWQAGGVGRVEV